MTDTELPSGSVSEDGNPSPSAPVSLDDWDDGAWDFPTEPSPVGPQGVFIRREDIAPGVTPDALPTDGVLVREDEAFSSPEERAEVRFARLSSAFSATLVIVAQMYRDEDWKYLRKDDGSEFTSLVEVCQVAMGKSVAMARRYVQGARDFYLPLSAVMVEGTRLEIASSDIATLGSDGIRSVVDEATDRMEGVDDPDEASEIVKDTLKGAREERERGREEASSGSDESGSTGGGEFYDPPESDASGPVETYTEDADEWPEDSPVSETGEPNPAGGGSYFVGADDDLIAPLLADAPLFDKDEELDKLPVAVKRVVRAMLVLEEADVAEIARALDFDNRGIIVHGDAAQKSLARIRAMAETQPWVLKRLEGSE